MLCSVYCGIIYACQSRLWGYGSGGSVTINTGTLSDGDGELTTLIIASMSSSNGRSVSMITGS